MPGFDNDWRCTHDTAKGCPNGGCDTGCAREKGWTGRLPARRQLDNLAQPLVDDVMALSDEEILAETHQSE